MSNSEARPREQRSLFGEILDWMLAPLLLLWPMSVVLTWLVAQGIANRPFDRELQDMVRVLSEQVVIASGASGQPQATFTFVPSVDPARLIASASACTAAYPVRK